MRVLDIVGYSTGLPPYTVGLRDLTGRVNADGTVSLYAATSTNSASGDAVADPNSIVSITDLLAATALPVTESFGIVEGAQSCVVYRGVAFAPVPEPGTLALIGTGVAGLIATRNRRRKLV